MINALATQIGAYSNDAIYYFISFDIKRDADCCCFGNGEQK